MPVSFSSPPRNLFLLGSSGADVVTNFFKTIDQSAGIDGRYLPSEIRYSEYDEKFILAGTAQTPSSKEFGWIEKRDDAGTADFENRIESTQTSVDTTLLAMELDVNDKLIVGGKTGDVPWIAKYSNGGVIEWQSTTNTANLEYTGITSDSNGQYYACGSQYPGSGAVAFVEKFDANGNPGWGKAGFMLGREVLLNAIAANSRGEVVAVGQIEDDNSYKGYIVKIDTNTGEVLWDRTLTQHLTAYGYVVCRDVYIDSKDQIYIVGARSGGNPSEPTEGFLIKYSPEGNIIWQKASYTPNGTLTNYAVKSDGGTEQTIVFGTYYDQINNDLGGVLSKYSKNGDLVWRRTIYSSYNNSDVFGSLALDADPSFYYLLYVDDNYNALNGTPEAYTFGKVSSSGNGLGSFQYQEGTGETISYDILNVQDKIGRLSDGSVRQNTSDLITYPFNANKILFDDLATQVSNKKRQMDGPDSFEYSGSPAIRIADFTELDLRDESFDVNVPANEVVYESAGTYTFTVPAGVTEVSAVAVGSGGGAASSPGANAQSGGGGGGGGLAYGTFTVTPGEDLTIVVGNFGVGGASGTTAGTAGESTTISRGATVLLEGGGGAGGQADAPAGNSTIGTTASGGSSSGTERDGGGSGGNGGPSRGNFGGGGGGGAGGYNGAGGNAGSGNSQVGTGGSGGGGGGGGGQSAAGTQNNGGGGVGLFGGPINGAGGAVGNPGSGGSNGQGGQPGGKGGKFGGGGGGAEDDTNRAGADGGIGGARIIWGAGRSFPNSALQDFSSVETRVRDKSGKGNDGVVNGATLNAAGYWEFDGVDDNIDLGSTPIIPSGSFTYEAWGWVDAFANLGNDECSLINYEGSNLSVLLLSAGSNYDGGVGHRFVVRKDGSNEISIRGNIAANGFNEWHHYVGVYDDDTQTAVAYVDGVQVNTGTNVNVSGWTAGTTSRQELGVSAGGVRHLDGRIGEVRIYPRALTAAQVFQNYNATKSKYISEASDTAPKITSNGIVVDSNLLLNYDFGNRATYDRTNQNLVPYSQGDNWVSNWTNVGATILSTTERSPIGTNDAVKYTGTGFVTDVSMTLGKTYVWSLYVKVVDAAGDTIKVGHGASQYGSSGNFTANINYNLSDWSEQYSPSGDNAYIYAAVPVGDGWYRIGGKAYKGDANQGQFEIYIGSMNATVMIWGPQLEEWEGIGAFDSVPPKASRYFGTTGTIVNNVPTTVKNLSSSSYNGELKGAVIIGGGFSYPTFNPDGYFDFDPADNQYIDITSLAPLADTSAVTMEAWVNVDTLTNTYQVIGTWERTTNHWQFTYSGDTNYGLSFGVAGSNDSVGITGSPATGSWQHVVATWNGGSLTTLSDWKIYVNGVSQTIQLTGATGTAGNDSYIGTRQGLAASNMLDGKMGEIRYYSRALTATEVSQNYNATRGKYGV